MAVIPADEGGAADHTLKVGAGDVERPVVRCAGREDDRVVEPDKLVDRHVAADRDMADEADIVGERRAFVAARDRLRSEEHTSELQSLMRMSYAVFCWKKKKTTAHKLDNKRAHH